MTDPCCPDYERRKCPATYLMFADFDCKRPHQEFDYDPDFSPAECPFCGALHLGTTDPPYIVPNDGRHYIWKV